MHLGSGCPNDYTPVLTQEECAAAVASITIPYRFLDSYQDSGINTWPSGCWFNGEGETIGNKRYKATLLVNAGSSVTISEREGAQVVCTDGVSYFLGTISAHQA